MKKILHITNWYPNKWNDLEALFIREQFDLFSEVSESKLLHVQVREDERWFGYEKVNYSEREIGYYIMTRVKTFRIIELLSTFLLFWALFQNKASKYDLLHFHIAYPLLTYYHLWKQIIKVPLIISEHWSAYHFNFFMPQETTKLDRMKNIFRQNLPLITVSKALLDDIQIFSGTKDFPAYIIPNVIDMELYHYKKYVKTDETPVFFTVNLWRSIKNPYPMLEAFYLLAKNGTKFQLNIGGYGPILEEMKAFVKEHQLGEQVVFLGRMYKKEIAEEMNRADAYLFSSEYETFSVVCAEALCCRCPLIGPAIPAILEYAGDDDITLLKANDVKGWEMALKMFLEMQESVDHETIEEKAKAFLSHKKIQAQYETIIYESCNA